MTQHVHQHHGSSGATADKAFVLSIVLNLLYVLVEIIAGIYFHSVALLSDAGHNVSDIISLLVSLLALRLARKGSSKKFTYGYRKTTVLAALFNALILWVAVGVLGYEIVQRFLHPAAVDGPLVAWVAGAGVVINTLSALLFYKSRRSDLNIKSAFLHLAADAVVSVGVAASGLLISYTGWTWVDPLVGAIVLVVVLVSTWGLLSESFRLSLDAVPSGIDLTEVRASIVSVPGVQKAEHLHVWAMSTTETAMTAHVILPPGLKGQQTVEIISAIKEKMQHLNIVHCTIEAGYG